MNPPERKRPEVGGGYRPTREQELLLRAALRGGEEAADAWREWYAAVDIERIDPGSQRILPLVYRNLRAQSTKIPDLGRLKGLYRHTWYKNRLLLHALAGRLRAFQEAGVETLILKGAALISYYKDAGSRPMGDFDVLVRPEQAPMAMQVLRDAGWRTDEVPAPEQTIPVRHALAFTDATHTVDCHLHWRVLQECCQAGDDDFWDAAVPDTIDAVPTRALGPADQLLHVCVHGARWHEFVPPVRWVADAVTVVNATNADGVDWDRLVEQARKRRLTLPLQETLGYLRESWDVTVSPAALRGLREAPVSYVERVEHAARMRPPTLPRAVLAHWARNARLMGDAGIGRQLAHFPAYYRRFHGLEHAWQAPLRAALAAGKRVKRLVRGAR